MSAVRSWDLAEAYGRWDSRADGSYEKLADAQVVLDLWSKAPFLVRLLALVRWARQR